MKRRNFIKSLLAVIAAPSLFVDIPVPNGNLNRAIRKNTGGKLAKDAMRDFRAEMIEAGYPDTTAGVREALLDCFVDGEISANQYLHAREVFQLEEFVLN